MECLESKNIIDNAFQVVRDASFAEKKLNVPTQAEVDSFLDNILGLQRLLLGKTTKIDSVNELLEKITWLDHINEESLIQINTLISVTKDFHSTLIKQFVQLHSIKSKGIAKQAIKDFKYSIDSLKDGIDDLESVFFSLPAMPEFKDTTKQLSLL